MLCPPPLARRLVVPAPAAAPASRFTRPHSAQRRLRTGTSAQRLRTGTNTQVLGTLNTSRVFKTHNSGIVHTIDWREARPYGTAVGTPAPHTLPRKCVCSPTNVNANTTASNVTFHVACPPGPRDTRLACVPPAAGERAEHVGGGGRATAAALLHAGAARPVNCKAQGSKPLGLVLLQRALFAPLG